MRILGAEKYDVEVISPLVVNFEIGEFHSQQRTGMVVITIVLFLNSDIFIIRRQNLMRIRAHAWIGSWITRGSKMRLFLQWRPQLLSDRMMMSYQSPNIVDKKYFCLLYL